MGTRWVAGGGGGVGCCLVDDTSMCATSARSEPRREEEEVKVPEDNTRNEQQGLISVRGGQAHVMGHGFGIELTLGLVPVKGRHGRRDEPLHRGLHALGVAQGGGEHPGVLAHLVRQLRDAPVEHGGEALDVLEAAQVLVRPDPRLLEGRDEVLQALLPYLSGTAPGGEVREGPQRLQHRLAAEQGRPVLGRGEVRRLDDKHVHAGADGCDIVDGLVES